MDPRTLVPAMLSGDEQSWRRFLEDYGRLVYSVSRRLGLDEAEGEDHFQAVCMAAHRSLGSLRDPDRLAAWIYNIAYRAGIDALRRRRAAIALSDLDDDEAPVEPGILEDLERLQAIAQLRDALGNLDPRCRDLLTALFLEEPVPSYEEIHRRAGIPIGSIGPTRARCLEKLKNRLDDLSTPTPPPSTGREASTSKAPETGTRETRE